MGTHPRHRVFDVVDVASVAFTNGRREVAEEQLVTSAASACVFKSERVHGTVGVVEKHFLRVCVEACLGGNRRLPEQRLHARS